MSQGLNKHLQPDLAIRILSVAQSRRGASAGTTGKRGDVLRASLWDAVELSFLVLGVEKATKVRLTRHGLIYRSGLHLHSDFTVV